MKKNKFLLLEVFIWFLLLGGLTFFAINAINYKFGIRPKYNVAFKDVDGLIVGSPVRIMGIQCGNITAVIPKDDQVYVSFTITQKDVNIPIGSKASIQFTGLAGSKSLEILPPQAKVDGKELFYPIEPIRINSLMEVQAKISESILTGSKNMYEFFGKEDEIKKNIKAAKILTKESLDSFNSSYDVIYSTNDILSKEIKNMNQFLSEQNKGFDTFSSEYYDLSFDKKIEKTFTGVDYSIYKPLNRDIPHKYLLKSIELNKKTNNANQQLNTSTLNKNSLSIFQIINNGICSLNEAFTKLKNKLSGNSVDKVQQKIEEVKIKTKKLKEKI